MGLLFGEMIGNEGWEEELSTVPSPATPYRRFDLNGDGKVDFDDFFLFADSFGKTETGER